MMLRRLLWSNRKVHPKDQPKRFKTILFAMERKSNIFGMCLLLFRKILCLFSGIIDVERKNGILKWTVYAKRERLLTEKLDKILRIFCNSPALDAGEERKKWLVAVAKIWWSAADRKIDCTELDNLCKDSDDLENEDIDLQIMQ